MVLGGSTGSNSKRVFALSIAVLAFVLLSALWIGTRDRQEPEQQGQATGDEDRIEGGSWFRASCNLPIEYLERTRRGRFGARSPDVVFFPKVPNYVGSDIYTTHAGPWEYVQSVPLVFYGKGFIESSGDLRLERDLDLTDLTATLADLLEVDLPHAVGRSIEEALVPQEQRSGTPKLIVTVVWDGGGWNLLNRWPNEWPKLRSLMERGTSVMGVTVGSSPSTTPAVHSTIGTGAFPRDHGAVDIPIRRNGKMVASFGDVTADDVVIPTIGDVYDLETNNEAKVAMIGEKAWHLGMLGHGASIEGGDKDVAVMWNLHHKLITNPVNYTLPSNLDVRPALDEELEELDAEDGRLDSVWMGNDVLADRGRWRHSPLWTMYQPELLRSVVIGQSMGQDDVTDLLFTNFKHIDVVGHYPNKKEELRLTVRRTDDALGEFVDDLDEHVGEGEWVLALTADHGVTPHPETSGAWPINVAILGDDIAERFGVETDELVLEDRPNGLWLNRETMRARGITPEQVSRFVMGYRLEDNIGPRNQDQIAGYEQRMDEKLFAAAAPGDRLDQILECARRR